MCCVEFISLISSEANEIAEKEQKKTISIEHIDKALRDLGFPEYVKEVIASAGDAKEMLKVRTLSIRLWRCGRSCTNCAGCISDTRKENDQTRAEWLDAGRTLRAATGAVQICDRQIQSGDVVGLAFT